MITFDEYARHDGLALAGLVRRGEISAAELLETAIARIEAQNPALNAVVRRLRDDAPLAPWVQATLYGGGAAGYTDYPVLEVATAG